MLFDLKIFSGGVYPPSATSRTISFFLFPIVFGINLIHFFDEKKDGPPENSIVCQVRCFDPLSRHLTEVKRSRRVRIFGRLRTVSKSATFLAKESVNSAPFTTGKTEVQLFGKEKCKILKLRQLQHFGKEKCKLLRQFQRC